MDYEQSDCVRVGGYIEAIQVFPPNDQFNRPVNVYIRGIGHFGIVVPNTYQRPIRWHEWLNHTVWLTVRATNMQRTVEGVEQPIGFTIMELTDYRIEGAADGKY